MVAITAGGLGRRRQISKSSLDLLSTNTHRSVASVPWAPRCAVQPDPRSSARRKPIRIGRTVQPAEDRRRHTAKRRSPSEATIAGEAFDPRRARHDHHRRTATCVLTADGRADADVATGTGGVV